MVRLCVHTLRFLKRHLVHMLCLEYLGQALVRTAAALLRQQFLCKSSSLW